jgi:hypothetical protein
MKRDILRHLSFAACPVSMPDHSTKVSLLFPIFFVSSLHPHSPLPPQKAGTAQHTGTVSIWLVPSMNKHGEFGAQNYGSILNPARPFHRLDGEDGTRSKLHGDGASLLVSSMRLHSFGFARIVDAGRALCTHFSFFKQNGCSDDDSLLTVYRLT